MEHDNLRDTFREGIVEKSIQILRAHGRNDNEIKKMILKNFSIKENVLDNLLKISR